MNKTYAHERLDEVAQRVVKGDYFKILFGKFTDGTLNPANTKPENGIERFDELIDSVFSHKPHVIIIELYKPTEKSYSKVSPLKYRIELNSEKTKKQDTNLAGVGVDETLQMFGGLGGIVQQNQMLAGYKTKLDAYEEKINDLKEEKRKLEKYKDKYEDLREDKRKLEFDIAVMQQKQRELKEYYENERKSSDRLLGIGGTIAANIMGLDKDTLMGYLGNIEPKAIGEGKEDAAAAATSPDDVEFKPTYEGKKAEANAFAEEITKWMHGIIETNDDDNALMLLRSVYNVFEYMAKSMDNINTLNELILNNDARKDYDNGKSE